MRPQADEGLGDRDVQLYCDHPGRLVNHVAEVGAVGEPRRQRAGRRAGLEHKHDFRRDINSLRELLYAE